MVGREGRPSNDGKRGAVMLRIGQDKGDLYFIREKDFLTQEVGDNVKIGLVRDGKTCQERASQLQTGNSQLLIVSECLNSNSINQLEATLHQHLATARLQGEWFVLPGKSIDEAIKIAVEIESRYASMGEMVQESTKLSKVESNESILKPTKKDVALHAEILELRTKKKELEWQIAELDYEIASDLQNHFGLQGIAHWKSSTPESKFNKREFQRRAAEFANELLKPSDTVTGPFVILGESKTPTPPKLPKPGNVDELVSGGSHRERTQHQERIHDARLVARVELSKLDLDLLEKTAELKTRVGTANGIEGLAKWTRERKPELPRDIEDIVKGEDEYLWRQCFKPAAKSVSLEVYDFRPYLSKANKYRIIN